MSRKTRATEMLEKSGVAFSVHTYDYDPNADRIGIQAAEAIGEPPQRVLKTLMALVDGKPVCAVVPSDHDVSMRSWRPRSAASPRR
jgi:Cys-tRNA(Pro)/Cys-tRNA(Cys) deacylase